MLVVHLIKLFTVPVVIANNFSINSRSRSYIPYDPHGPYHLVSLYPPNQHPHPSIPMGKHPGPSAYNYGYSGKAMEKFPSCVKDSNQKFCFEDNDYPKYEILELYQKYPEAKYLPTDSFPIDTTKSVDGLTSLDAEKYLCASNINYTKLLRAEDINGKWQVIVNVDGYTQTVRMELCQSTGAACPLVPSCFSTSCVQKYAYHRLLTLGSYDHYNSPFSVGIFKIPSACSCLTT